MKRRTESEIWAIIRTKKKYALIAIFKRIWAGTASVIRVIRNIQGFQDSLFVQKLRFSEGEREKKKREKNDDCTFDRGSN